MTFFDARNNPSLTLIGVDDVAYAAANWINIDSQTNFYSVTTIGELDGNKHIKILPNPSDGLINIEYRQATKKKAYVKIINSIGKLLYTTNINSSKQIDLQQYGRGICFVQLIIGGNIQTEKVVIE